MGHKYSGTANGPLGQLDIFIIFSHFIFFEANVKLVPQLKCYHLGVDIDKETGSLWFK